jgi:hypothetical protein
MHQHLLAGLEELMCREVELQRLDRPPVGAGAEREQDGATVLAMGPVAADRSGERDDVGAVATHGCVAHLPQPLHAQWEVLSRELEAWYWRLGRSVDERTAVLDVLRAAFLKHAAIGFDDETCATPAGAMRDLEEWAARIDGGLLSEMRMREILLYRLRGATC